jgi:hypothetical protein
MKVSILPLGTEDLASSRLQCHILLRSLREMGVHAQLEYAADADVVFIQKRWDLATLAIARDARATGKALLFSMDDPIDNDSPSLREIFRLSHEVLTDTAGHGAWIQRRYGNASFAVQPDPVDYDATGPARGPRLPDQPLRVVWFGSRGNFASLAKYVEVIGSLPDTRLVACVHRDDVAPLGAHFPGVEFIPWARDTFVSSLQSCHISCLSHELGETHRLKGNSKMVTSILWGVPCVASRTPDYALAAQIGGVEDALYEDTPSLVAAIERYRTPGSREAYLDRAQGPLWERYSPHAVARIFMATCERVIASMPRPAETPSRVTRELERLADISAWGRWRMGRIIKRTGLIKS